MYHSIDDFLNEWRQESASTLNFLQHLTDASLAQPVDDEGWTLGRIVWHLATAPAQMLRVAGLPVDGPDDEAPVPGTAAEIAKVYAAISDSLLQQIGAWWHDAMLTDEISAFGQCWSRGEMLTVVLRHQTHHRGQASVLARQAGIRIPGVCGPTREEMAALRAQFLNQAEQE